MNYNEFQDKFLFKKINIGDKVWICDFRYNDISKSPIRHVPPQKVFIESNDNLPSNKIVYYSSIHFKPIGKKGQKLKQVIAPFDNTGYRTYTGISVNIFLSEKECKEFYKKQCEDILNAIKVEKERYNKYLDELLDTIKEEKNNYL